MAGGCAKIFGVFLLLLPGGRGFAHLESPLLQTLKINNNIEFVDQNVSGSLVLLGDKKENLFPQKFILSKAEKSSALFTYYQSFSHLLSKKKKFVLRKEIVEKFNILFEAPDEKEVLLQAIYYCLALYFLDYKDDALYYLNFSLKKMDEKTPFYQRARFVLSSLYFVNGNYKVALDMARDILIKIKDEPIENPGIFGLKKVLLLEIARIYFKQRNFLSASQWYNTLLNEPTDKNIFDIAYLEAAYTFKILGKEDLATLHFAKVSREAKNRFDDLLFLQSKEYGEQIARESQQDAVFCQGVLAKFKDKNPISRLDKMISLGKLYRVDMPMLQLQRMRNLLQEEKQQEDALVSLVNATNLLDFQYLGELDKQSLKTIENFFSMQLNLLLNFNHLTNIESQILKSSIELEDNFEQKRGHILGSLVGIEHILNGDESKNSSFYIPNIPRTNYLIWRDFLNLKADFSGLKNALGENNINIISLEHEIGFLKKKIVDNILETRIEDLNINSIPWKIDDFLRINKIFKDVSKQFLDLTKRNRKTFSGAEDILAIKSIDAVWDNLFATLSSLENGIQALQKKITQRHLAIRKKVILVKDEILKNQKNAVPASQEIEHLLESLEQEYADKILKNINLFQESLAFKRTIAESIALKKASQKHHHSPQGLSGVKN